MSESSSRKNQQNDKPKQKTSSQDQKSEHEMPSSGAEVRDDNACHGKGFEGDYCQTSEAVITIESESVDSSDTELSTYVTCCSECDHVQHSDEAHDKNNNKNTNGRLVNNLDKFGGKEGLRRFKSDKEKVSEEGKIHEALNYQVKTNPKSGKKIESEEMRIKITETKENVKAITTIHLIHTSDQESDIEGNVSRKKRLFAQNKKPNETGSGNKYRKLFYELPETSTETHYAEEEFVYEPRFRTTTTKLVMKARSLINLNDEEDRDRSEGKPDHNFGTRSSGSFKENLQRYKSEPDLDAIRNARTEAKRFEFDNDIRFQCNEKHLECKMNQTSRIDSKNATNRIEDEVSSTCNNVKENDSGECNKTPSYPNTKVDETKRGECWITGATFKSPTEVKEENFLWGTCPKRDRFCFYYPKKRNREIIDDELPDPDKVKDIRNKFEQTIKTKTEHASHTLNHPKKRSPENRVNKHQFNTWSPAYHTYPTVEITQSKDVKNCQSKLSDSQKFKYWSDTTSISSGVASDFSCETDSESSPRAETIDMFRITSESETGQPVSADTLKKIRACGTTTTYYGGRIISCDKGTVRSPMTMTIMDEIRQNIKENEVNLQLGIKSLQNKYSGMKFRLVKSNSCGSRLELTGINSRDRSKKQNQPILHVNQSKKLESVSENDLSHSCSERWSTENNTAPEVSVSKPIVTKNSEEANFRSDLNETENNESPEICPLPAKQDSKDHGDYNSICLIENGEVQTGAHIENKGLPSFLRMKGHSTKDIVKAFESVNAQKEEIPTAPWKSLIESRKQANRMASVKRIPVFEEMEFEEFQVLDESAKTVSQNSNPTIIEQNS